MTHEETRERIETDRSFVYIGTVGDISARFCRTGYDTDNGMVFQRTRDRSAVELVRLTAQGNVMVLATLTPSEASALGELLKRGG